MYLYNIGIVSVILFQGTISQLLGRNVGFTQGDRDDCYNWNTRSRLPSDITTAGILGASNGGALTFISKSAVSPTGLSVTSENVFEGKVAVNGNLPFLGSANVEGNFLSSGSGGINYGCSDGAVGIVDEQTSATATVSPGIGFKGYADVGCGYVY